MQVLIKPRPVLKPTTRWSQIRAWRLPLRWYRRLTLVTAGAIWLLIVLGGLVRVTDSGTGCGSSWPMCHGHLLPNLEYHELIEWNHRLIATLVGLLMVVTIGATLLWYRQPRRLVAMALLAGLTYVAQAVLGGITVLLHLDHTWVAAHMGNSMLLLASVVLLATFARRPFQVQPPLRPANRRLRWLLAGTLGWTYVALFSGSAVIGAQADLACPAWPQCSPNAVLPDQLDQWVNFGHRLAVGLSDVLLLGLGLFIWRTRRHERSLMRAVHVLGVLYVSQVFLGAFTIWLAAPAALKGAHLALAAATWGTLVVMAVLAWKETGIAVKPEEQDSGRTGGTGSASDTEPVKETLSVAESLELASSRQKFFSPSALVLFLSNYLGLMRLQVIPLLLVPTGAAMLIASVQHPPHRPLWELIGLVMLGGTLAAGGAHTINQYLDRDIDAKMRRTRRRAVVTGRVRPERALAFGIGLSLAAFGVLWLGVNPLSALLALFGHLFYVVVYTLWLKRSSTQNIVIGGAAGAVPPLVGWAAVTGQVELPAILFFAIIFFWTPAHFWALALVRNEDYTAAGVPMLPVVRGERYTRRSILVYSLLLVGATLVPFALQALGWLYLVAAIGLGGVLLRQALRLQRGTSTIGAWRMFKFSNTYLALLYIVMVLDRLVVA